MSDISIPSNGHVLDPKLGRIANFHIPRACDFNFRVITNLKVYKGFDRQNRPGCNFTPLVTIDGQISFRLSKLEHHLGNAA